MGRDARHYAGPGRVAHWLPVVLVAVLLGAAVPVHRFEVGERHLPWLVADPAAEPAAVAPPVGLDLPDWSPPEALADPAPTDRAVDPVAVAAALGPGLADPDLGRHVVAAVGDLPGASADWTFGDGRYVPASTTKLLTVAAVLERLGPDARFTTRVVKSASQEVVLVGGGDPLLASRPLSGDAARTTYPARADVTTLARKAARKLAATGALRRVRVRYDDSLFTGPTASEKWRADYVPDDIVSPITALMVDSGRERPDDYRRTDDPSLAAAQAFSEALAAAGVTVAGRPRPAVAPPDATELAAVESAPLAQIAERVLDVSDNEGAEVLAHHVGLAAAGEGSFTAGAAGVLETLQGWGLDTSADRLHDGSGLSRHNRVAAATILGVLRHAAGPDGARTRSLLTGLPVAGFTGSLTHRFDDVPAAARGAVRAKTGTLSGVHSLAGLATGRDGTPMVFVVAADKVAFEDGLDAQAALDRVAASLARCRCAVGG